MTEIWFPNRHFSFFCAGYGVIRGGDTRDVVVTLWNIPIPNFLVSAFFLSLFDQRINHKTLCYVTLLLDAHRLDTAANGIVAQSSHLSCLLSSPLFVICIRSCTLDGHVDGHVRVDCLPKICAFNLHVYKMSDFVSIPFCQ